MRVYVRAHRLISQQVTIELSTQSPAEGDGWGVRSTSTETHSPHTFPPPHPSSERYKNSAPAEVVQSRHQLHQVRQTTAGTRDCREGVREGQLVDLPESV